MAVESPATTGRQLTFRVGGGRFAVLLESVLGVQEPASGGAGTGRVTFKGHLVETVDARSLGWGGSGEPQPQAAAVIIVGGGATGETALIVDRVEGIVEGVEMRPLPALVAPFLRGVFGGYALHADGGRLMVDPAALSAAAGKMPARGGQRGPGEA